MLAKQAPATLTLLQCLFEQIHQASNDHYKSTRSHLPIIKPWCPPFLQNPFEETRCPISPSHLAHLFPSSVLTARFQTDVHHSPQISPFCSSPTFPFPSLPLPAPAPFLTHSQPASSLLENKIPLRQRQPLTGFRGHLHAIGLDSIPLGIDFHFRHDIIELHVFLSYIATIFHRDDRFA